MKYNPEDTSKFEELNHILWKNIDLEMTNPERPMKKTLQSDLIFFLISQKKEAYEAGRREGLEEVEKEIVRGFKEASLDSWNVPYMYELHFIEIINRLKG
jgi:hypothetical protein